MPQRAGSGSVLQSNEMRAAKQQQVQRPRAHVCPLSAVSKATTL